jgi:hypothetical protein
VVKDGVFILPNEGRVGSAMNWLYMRLLIMVCCRFVNLASINCRDNYSTTIQSPCTQTKKSEERRVKSFIQAMIPTHSHNPRAATSP